MRVRKFPDSLSWTPAHTAVYSTRSAHPSLTPARATTVGLTHTSYTRTMPAAGSSSTSGWPCREPLCTGTFTPSQNVVSELMTRHSARLDLVLEHRTTTRHHAPRLLKLSPNHSTLPGGEGAAAHTLCPTRMQTGRWVHIDDASDRTSSGHVAEKNTVWRSERMWPTIFCTGGAQAAGQ